MGDIEVYQILKISKILNSDINRSVGVLGFNGILSMMNHWPWEK
tara:strand:- start:4735 stop:4866 length:132 start_codon:yes stop_codon:yes gene_type:complete